MNDLDKKTELDDKQIEQIRLILAYKANDWLLSRGRICDGMEVFRTQDEERFVLKDIETGVRLGMRKQVKDGGVITHVTFFKVDD